MNTLQEPSSSTESDAEVQPINLANKPASSPGRVLEQSKSIYLVKPTTTLAAGPVANSVVGAPQTNTPPPAHTASTTCQQPVGPSVAVPMAMAVPITMTRLQTAVRPGTPIALAPRAVPTVTSVPYSSLSVPVSQIPTLHVPKGPAAVANLSVPRAAVAQPSSSSRPGTPVPAAPSSSATPVALTKPMRPTIATVRPSGLIVGSPSSIPTTWLPVSASTLSTGTAQLVTAPTSTAARPPTSLPSKSNPSAIKSIPLPTPISVGGQARVPAPRSAIMTVNTRAPLSGTSPRAVSDIVRPGQPATVRPLVTLPSSTLIQVGDKQFTKSGSTPASSTATSTAATSTGSRSIGILQQASRPASSSSTANQSSTGIASLPGRITVSTVVNTTTASQGTGQPLIFPGGLKPAASSGPKVPLPQISLSTVSSKSFHVASTVPTRPVTVASTSAPPALSSRPLIISGAPNPASVLPVAKVLPQPILASASAPVKAVDLSTGPSSASVVPAQPSGPAESHPPAITPGTGQLQPTSSGPTLPPGIYLQKSGNGSQGEKSASGPYGFPGATIFYETTERTSFHSFLPTSGTLIQQPASRSGGSTSSDMLLSVSSQSSSLSAMQSVTSKVGSSPRPSILRKRDHDGTPLKAQRTLFSSTTSTQVTSSTATSIVAAASVVSSISPPSELTIHGESSRSSTGSTTLSASSSPGIPADLEDSNPLPPPPIISSNASLIGKALSAIQVKQENTAESSAPRLPSVSVAQGPPVEMSPRKKPRKQQLNLVSSRLGQELQEVRSSDEELRQQLLLLSKPDVVKREPPPPPKEAAEAAAVLKRPRASLMSTCKQTWKSRNNHFVRHSDVKLKDERRPTVTDLANQKQVMQKVNGWKVYHLSAQIEEMARLENEAHERLTTLLDLMESLGGATAGADRDLTRVHELIKGNLQRSKVIQDQLQESKTQVLKVFEHKPRVEEIIHRYMFKRLPKKREKS